MDNWEEPARYNSNSINIHENYEVEYWTKVIGISAEELRKAVAIVGNSAEAIKDHLHINNN